jgi:HSP20 family molecular chaperone IbpA
LAGTLETINPKQQQIMIGNLFQKQLDDLLDTTFVILPQSHPCPEDCRKPFRTPSCSIDIRETENAFIVKAELPGVSKEDIQVTANKNVLTIAAEKKKDSKDINGKWHLEERRFGKIERNIYLPENCNPDQVNAQFQNGILELVFSKKAKESTKKICIS